jgi:hypothetical protein
VISNRNANNSNFLIGAKDMLKDALTIIFIFTIFINIVNNFGEMECQVSLCFSNILLEKGNPKKDKNKCPK